MTYGNLAYKYDYIDGNKTGYRSRENRQSGKASANTASEQMRRAAERKKTKKISFPAKVASIVVVTISAISMIVQFVEVKETLAVLDEAKTQYAFEQSVTSQKSFELEQSIDLSKIEQEATTRLGMKRPERHQIVYIDVPKDDVTEKTAGEVEGFKNRAVAVGKSIISHIVEFFSI
ncbi:MAG: hypothetical protein ACI4EA_01890 [Candidatus Ornithomonoglobus sp.]